MLRQIAFRSVRNSCAIKPASRSIATAPAVQPDLSYDFGALEPFISADIMETHYTKHHRTYINGYNTNIEKLQDAINKNDVLTQTQLLPLIKFNGGGFVNHNLFWKSLAPKSAGGGDIPSDSSTLGKAIAAKYKSVDNLIAATNAKLAGIQGSGWAWIVQHSATGELDVITTLNQDTVPSQYHPLIGIDAWEHAYYLQYKNVKVDYFKAIWNVINWKEAESRFLVK